MTTQRKVYQELASRIDAYHRCVANGNKYADEHWHTIKEIVSNGPSGSGINSGCKFDFDRSNGERLVINTSFHHMNDVGYYDGWTDHAIIVTASLLFGINIHITGRNKRDIKEYLHEVFHSWLTDDTV